MQDKDAECSDESIKTGAGECLVGGCVCVCVCALTGGIWKYVCVQWTNTKESPVREGWCVRESMESLFTGTVGH